MKMKRRRRRNQGSAASPETGRRAAGSAPSWASARFTVIFLLLILVLALATATAAADRWIHQPISQVTAVLASSILRLFGSVSRQGAFLYFNGFSATIEDACDGVLPAYIFFSAIVAFPSRIEQKLWGVLLGLPAIFGLNLLRVVTLMLVGAYWPALFEKVHIYVWQALVVALSMVLWIVWAEMVVRPAAPARS